MSTDELTRERDERPLRADAARNRERILAAAAEVFAEHGLEVTLDDIARHAGVGVGTVYRRFADKDQLIEALFDQRLDQIRALAEESLTAADAFAGFEGFMTSSLELQAADRGLRELAFAGKVGRERIERARAEIVPLIDRLVERAQADGQLRADLDAVDVHVVQKMLCAVMDMTVAVDRDAWRRYLVLAIDGLRPAGAAPTPLPVPALSHDQVADCIRTQHSRHRRA
jgi:AcrR family transcriptional regulator